MKVCSRCHGAVGKRLIPVLVGGGHEVFGTTRSESRGSALSELGATPVIVDALDASA